MVLFVRKKNEVDKRKCAWLSKSLEDEMLISIQQRLNIQFLKNPNNAALVEFGVSKILTIKDKKQVIIGWIFL